MTGPSHHLERARELRIARKRMGDPRAVNAAEAHRRQLTAGERAADAFARTVGSWRFIGAQSVVLLAWVALNATGVVVTPWDPYPFILLNLALSFQAAYAAPILMMSQNRQADLDRTAARIDFDVNQKAESEVEEILALLHAQVQLTDSLRQELLELRARLS